MPETYDKPHEVVMTTRTKVMLDPHGKRADTVWFEHTKKHLTHDLDIGCWICGTKENREVHHFHVERCLAEEVLWGPGSLLRQDFPNFPWDKITSIYEFVDSADNCRVYCREHHTGKGLSVHRSPHPEHNAMRYMSEETRNRYSEGDNGQ